MLGSISDEGQGMYYFLEKKEDIPKSFGDCLGGLLSTVAQNITLEIETKNEVQLLTYLSKFKSNGIQKQNKISINIGDMLSEEKRDILFQLKLPKINNEIDEFETCKVTLTYLNIIEMSDEKIEIVPSIKRVSKITENYKKKK